MDAIRGSLWSEPFGPRTKDIHHAARDRLKQGLLQMREKVAQLITTIPSDCKDLTVHDVTHLDALWEMASIIAGKGYDLNPAEVFVLGGGILLHGAGLSVAASPDGLSGLRRPKLGVTQECANYLRNSGYAAT